MLLRLTTVVAAFLAWVPVAQAWSWPVRGPVVQGFSYDESHPYAAGQHRGIDIGAASGGASVVAPASGTVSFAGSVPTSGKSVTIETTDGYSVTLTHLGSISVAQGATVVEGAAVGTVGPSGTPEVSGPYVHLGIRTTADPNGYLDPLSLLPPITTPPPTSTTGSPPAAGKPKAAHGGGGIVVRDPAPAAPAARPAESARTSRPGTSRPRPQAKPAAGKPKAAHGGGGIVVRDPAPAAPAARPAESARTSRPGTSRPRPQAKPASHPRPRTRPLQQPVAEATPALLVHAARPVPEGAASPSYSRRAQPVQSPLQLGLAAGPGIVAGLAAIATALVRLRRRRREPVTATVGRVLHLPGRGLPVHRAA
jgi:hypothetical protein